MSVEDNNGKLRLKEIHTGADVLHAVQCFIGLAVGSDMPCTNLQEQPSTPKIHQHEKDPASDPVYLAVHLHDAKSQTRLIELLSGRDGDPIKINLFAIGNLSTQPYDALSYVWGPRDADVTVSVNDRPFDVSANLAQALNCLRLMEGNKVLWVDAICINQADDIEKSHQVSLMGEIYRNAEDVVIFLGKESDDSAMVMQYLNLDDVEQTESQSQPVSEDRLKMGNAEDPRIIQERIQRCGFEEAHFLCAANAFFKRPWWSRVWVIQEYELAKREPRWYCGRAWTSTANVQNRLKMLSTHLIMEATPTRGNAAVSTQAKLDVQREWIKMNELRWNIDMRIIDRRAQMKGQGPYQMMVRMLRRQCTDPRDRIFASREMLDPVSRQVFVPNYAVTVNEIFVKLTSYVLIHEELGHIYRYYELAHSRDMPSWALDFGTPISAHGVTQLNPYRESALWAKDVGHLSIYNGLLGVPGVEIDTLDLAECFGDTSDIELLGKFWKLEGLLQKISPLEALPEEAQPFVPSYCLVPFSNLNENLRQAGADLMNAQFLTTLTIPGYVYVSMEILKLLLKRLAVYPKDLTCEAWQQSKATSRVPFDNPLLQATKLLLASVEAKGAESFLGGACFDLPNLKKQIMSVRLPESSHHDLTNLQGPGNLKASQGNQRETADGSRLYSPQYSHIKDILRQAKSQIEFESLQNTACNLADAYCKIVASYINNRASLGTQVQQVITELECTTSGSLTPIESHIRELSEKCTCIGDKRVGHQKELKYSIDFIERARETFAAITAFFSANRFLERFGAVPGMSMAFRRQYRGIFISRLGLFGVSFQRRPDLKKGNKIVVLDGIPTPIILEETADGATYRMKAAADVVGIKHVDIARLVELGVCTRRDFKIV
jgi:Heterokaryon incompatibility protein (HET)